MNKRYYEIELAHTQFTPETENDDTYSICIIAEHYPSIEEAIKFCKEDMKKLKYEFVRGITNISKEEAYSFFDMEDEKAFPILK